MRFTLMASTATTFLFMNPCAALAQEAPAAAEETIVVTGTRITNPNLVQSTPVLAVGEDEIELQNANTAEELLRQLPGSVPSIGPAVNNGTDGSARIDLRGLGSNRNLVLVDGQRFTPVGLDGVVDLNNIPLALVERVDVVTGGASSVYGADAISGAINFIIKDDFEGVELETSYRFSQRTDGEVFRADLTLGGNVADGRGNVVLALGYQDANSVSQGDRPFSAQGFSSTTGGVQGSGTAVPTRFLGPITGQLNPTTGTIGPNTSTFNFNPFNVFQTPFERFNIFTKGHYDLTPNVQVYGRGVFSNNSVTQIIAPSGTFFNDYELPLSNPFLTTAIRNQFCAADQNPATTAIDPIPQAECDAAALITNPSDPAFRSVVITPGRRFVELGPRFSEFDSTVFQFTAGLRGDIGTWSWDVSGQYGESDQTQTNRGQGLFDRAQQALFAVSPTACLDPSGGCSPINLFGPAGTLGGPNGTAALAAFLDVTTSVRTRTSLATAVATINGDLGSFKSPFATQPVGVAGGIEYRRLSAAIIPDLASATQDAILGAGAPTPPTSGAYDVIEGFGETIIPLIEDVPLVYNLTAEGGVRLSAYSNTGFSTTWKVGGSYSPIKDLRIRGVYQRAVRSPNISELFSPAVTGLQNLATDPCAGTITPAVAALCLLQGAPAGVIGNIANPSAGQINATGGGNPNLDVERAQTFTAGFVYRPSWLSRFNLTFDYFNIFVDGAISTPTVSDIFGPCFDIAQNPTLAAVPQCSLVGRNPSNGSLNGGGNTLGVIQDLSNLGQINTSGFDFSAAFGFDFDDFGLDRLGSVNWNFNGVYALEQRFQATPTSVDRECIGFYSVNCPGATETQIPQPQLQFNQRLTYSWNILDVSLQHRYVGPLSVEPGVTGAGGVPFLAAFSNTKARHYLDLTTRADVSKNITLAMTVDNLTDVGPPNVGNTIGSTSANSGNTFPTLFDTVGRTFTFSVRARF